MSNNKEIFEYNNPNVKFGFVPNIILNIKIMEKKQSSLDYLIEQLEGENNRIAMVVGIKKYNSIIQQAKAMHKEEIVKAYWGIGENVLMNTGDHYYNETFGGEK